MGPFRPESVYNCTYGFTTAVRNRARPQSGGCALAPSSGPGTAAQPRLTQQDADRCQGKLGRIQGFATAPKAKAQAKGSSATSQTTQLTDAELNCVHALQPQGPGAGGRRRSDAQRPRRRDACAARPSSISTRSASRSSAGGPIRMSYMTGRLPLTAVRAAHHAERRRPIPARVGRDLRHLDSQEPAAGTALVLLEVG